MAFSDDLKLTDGVNNLRNQFRQTFDCLQHLQLRLESQIEEGDYPSSINPIKLSQRIKALQKMLTDMQKRADALSEKKKTVVPKLIEQITQSAINVHQLRGQSGLKTSGIPENVVSDFYDEMVKLDGIKHGVENEDPNNNENNRSGMSEQFEQQNMNIPENDTDLTEERFNNLPPSTKQRVTFDHLDEAYQIIQELYWAQTGKKRKPIAIKVLASKGIKLSGQTGTAMINCLRSLKLIQTSKEGIACLNE